MALLALVAGACGDDDSSDNPTAILRILSTPVEVQEPGGGFAPGVDGQVLAEGAVIRTSSSGRASLEWFDGSVTRLDYNTEFTITNLQVATAIAGSQIEADQDSGGTYHRVIELTETGGRFSVDTPTAAAAVQGTTYAVVLNPDGSTSVIVTDGTVLVTSATGAEVAVEAGSMVTVDADGEITGPVPIPDEVRNSGWIQFNETCDEGSCPTAISPGSVSAIEISPVDATINQGESQAYSTQGLDSAGNPVGQVPATYDMNGVPCDGSNCTPLEPGDYTVTATFAEHTATANLTVLATGDIQVTLDWSAFADLDLWVTGPDGETIKYDSPASSSGGRLDRDAYPDCEFSQVPPENTVWDTTAPSGEYLVTVHLYNICGESEVAFELTVSIGGEVILVVDDVVLTFTDETYEVTFEKP